MEQNKTGVQEQEKPTPIQNAAVQQPNITRRYETEPTERRELPPVIKEKIVKEEVYEVQPIIYRTIIKPEIRRIEKQIRQSSLAPIQNSTHTLPAQNRDVEIRGDIPSKYRELLLDPKYENDEIIRVELPPIVREVVRNVTIHEVQPVILRNAPPTSTKEAQLSQVSITETTTNTVPSNTTSSM